MILKSIKLKIAREIARKRLNKRLDNKREDSRNILMNVPSHGNLGDHLICVAEKKLLKKISDKKLDVITTGEIFYGYDIIKSYIKEGDVLFITGGGYLGSLWPDEELRIQRIIRDFSKNKIIILPQTIYYDYSEESSKMIKEAKTIYNSHQDLTLIVREKNSYDFAHDVLGVKNLISLPDMALYLKVNKATERDGILICMRNDKEKLTNRQLENLISNLEHTHTLRRFDTVVNRSIPQCREEEEVDKLMSEFCNSKVVITDRLHGMIYSIITSTPVIVFNNLSNKIKNVYETWLKDISYILYVDENNFDINKITSFIKEESSIQNDYDNTKFIDLIESLEQKL